ncbi:hypothetical protein BJ878DRAFT_475716 [Calycina marina]|uniref:Uncharacterized protein n=1 Tax=Calycina marina TaxID=1763456 RepID=A0A9P8CJS8_9HELO|nr:hypothetical protein BJ878DRAFT_475716 [Calycina marina]
MAHFVADGEITRLLVISQFKSRWVLRSIFGLFLKANVNPLLKLITDTYQVNEYHARHNIYFQNYLREHDHRVIAQDDTWSAYNVLKALKDRHLPTSCSPERLRSIFSSLPNLHTLDVTLRACPFTTDDTAFLSQIWTIPSTRLLPQVATTERFTAILCCLKPPSEDTPSSLTLSKDDSTTWSQEEKTSTGFSVPVPLKHLTHDRLPFEFFAQKLSLINTFCTIFTTLECLSLTLDYSELPNNLHTTQAFTNLPHCLHSPPYLQTLTLCMLGRHKPSISPLLTLLTPDTNTPNPPPFPKLHKLTLSGVSCTSPELSSFLLAQKALRKLRLDGEGLRRKHQGVNGGVHLVEGTW